MTRPESAWCGLIRVGNDMNIGDLIRYIHKPEQVGVIVEITYARMQGDIYRILWGDDCRDVRAPSWYVHPDWVEVVQHG